MFFGPDVHISFLGGVSRAAAAGQWLARRGAGSGRVTVPGGDEGTLSMWVFLTRRLRTWLLLAIALPLARAPLHRLAVGAGQRDASTRTARALRQADSTVSAVSRRTASKRDRRRDRREARRSREV